MKEIKTLDCKTKTHPATATISSYPRPKAVKVNDLAVLICQGVNVIIKVTHIDGDTITGEVHHFENYDKEDLDGVMEGDILQFDRNKINDWHL